MRVDDAMTFDFVDIGEGMIRNNVGVEAITLEVQVRAGDGEVQLVPGGQRLVLRGPAPDDGWTWLRVHDWDEPELTAVSVVPPPAAAARDPDP